MCTENSCTGLIFNKIYDPTISKVTVAKAKHFLFFFRFVIQCFYNSFYSVASKTKPEQRLNKKKKGRYFFAFLFYHHFNKFLFTLSMSIHFCFISSHFILTKLYVWFFSNCTRKSRIIAFSFVLYNFFFFFLRNNIHLYIYYNFFLNYK